MDHHRQPTPYWRCLNCGQIYFGEAPPDICPFCRDITTWGNHRLQIHLPDGDIESFTTQLPLIDDDLEA